MAANKSSDSNQELHDVLTLKIKLKTSEAVFQGVCAVNNWREGKAVAEDEYVKAVDAFLKRPIGGGK